MMLPAVGLFLAALAGAVVLTLLTAREINSVRRQAEEATMRHAVAHVLETMRGTIGDYGFWDQTYDWAMTAAPDTGWAEDNLGPYLARNHGWTEVIVFSSRDAVMYHYESLAEGPPAGPQEARHEVARLLAAEVRAIPDVFGPRATAMLVEVEGRLHLGAAAVIHPNSVEAHAGHPDNEPVLIGLLAVDSASLREFLGGFGFAGVSASPSSLRASDPAAATFPVFAAAQPWTLTWLPARPGDAVWSRLMPVAGVGLGVLAIAVLFIMHTASVVSERLQAAAVRAVEAEAGAREKEKFISTMSHELRTPLNAVIGFADLMAEEMLGPHAVPQYKTYAADIRRSGQHQLAIVDDVLLMGQLTTGHFKPDLEAVDLKTVLEAAAADVAPEAARRAVAVRLDLPPRLLPALVEREALRRALNSLLHNALKFSSSGMQIRIMAAVSGGERPIGILIQDQGCGIPAEHLPLLGRPFAQVADALAREHGGPGLGLAIARGLTEAMGGTFKLVSRAGDGTTAILSLRAAPAAARARAA